MPRVVHVSLAVMLTSLALAVAAPAAGSAPPGEQVVHGELLVGTGGRSVGDYSVFLFGSNYAEGVDSAYFPLAAVADGDERVRLEWSSDVGAHLRVRFLHDRWRWIQSDACDTIGPPVTSGVQECVAPAGADHVLVALGPGARAQFTLRYSH